MGLHGDSVVMTDNLATVLESEVDRSIGICPIMPAVDTALRMTLGLRRLVQNQPFGSLINC